MSKKLIAGAGVVASLAVALAPLATFATVVDGNAHKDTIKATIEPVCSFGHTLTSGDIAIGSHINGVASGDTDPVSTPASGDKKGTGAGVWDSASATNYIVADSTSGHIWNGATATAANAIPTETLWGVVENNTEYTNFGKTVLHVYCNVKTGYQITATPTALTGDNSQTAIAYGYTSGTSESKWGFQVAATADRGTVANGANSFSPALNLPAEGTKTSVVITDTANHTTGNLGDEYTITYGMGISATQEAGTYTGTVDYVLAEL